MTDASESSQWLLQTVPQTPFAYTSTVPSNSFLPPPSRTDPKVEKNPKSFNSKEQLEHTEPVIGQHDFSTEVVKDPVRMLWPPLFTACAPSFK